MKMKKKLNMVFILMGASMVIMSLSSSTFYQTGEWVAPPEADKLVNPVANDAKATARGKKIYNQLCWVCHGKLGKGDGPTGKDLDPRPANHASSAVQSQSDGAIYWKIGKGKGEMTAYGNLLSKTQRWQLTNYIRTLSEQ